MKKYYCPKCHEYRNDNNGDKFCYKCGASLEENNEGNILLATKHTDSKGAYILLYIFVPIAVILTFSILPFALGHPIAGVICTILSIIISGLLDWLLVYSSKRDEKYPMNVIEYNQVVRYFNIYTSKGYKSINLEEINKVIMNNVTIVCTGKTVVPIVTKHGYFTFKLKNGTKINSIRVSEAKSVKEKIDEIIEQNQE